MIFDRKQVMKLKERYKEGMRVRLIKMDDVQAPSPGTEGTVLGVDDVGSVLMQWDNGCGLSIVPEEDEFEVIDII